MGTDSGYSFGTTVDGVPPFFEISTSAVVPVQFESHVLRQKDKEEHENAPLYLFGGKKDGGTRTRKVGEIVPCLICAEMREGRECRNAGQIRTASVGKARV